MIDAYLGALARRLEAVAGDELVGVYAGGSYALGAYEHGRSDVDVAAVLESRATRALKERIVEAVRHESLPCPARGLELVVYRIAAVGEPTIEAGFELNLNTGARMTFRADFEPDPVETHWFAIDRSILARRGIAISGPPARDVFADIPRPALLPVVRESVEWHLTNDVRADDAVLNACRAWRFGVEGVWSSKSEAGAWALAQPGTRPVVGQALERRTLDPAAVDGFLRTVLGRLH